MTKLTGVHTGNVWAKAEDSAGEVQQLSVFVQHGSDKKKWSFGGAPPPHRPLPIRQDSSVIFDPHVACGRSIMRSD